MTKDEILQKHEDENEYHFHQVDREWIMEAMQEYADQQLRLYGVVGQSEQLPRKSSYEPCGGCDTSCKYWMPFFCDKK